MVPRYIKLIIVEPTNSEACLKIELIGCAVQGMHTTEKQDKHAALDF
jgi:hypothetical protein